MNWVGGSRNRLVMRNDAKRQREFFEKRKMQQRLEKLGLTLPASSSKDTGAGSVDLMTLFIVNQIATKKENQDPPKVAVLGRFKGGSKYRRNESLVLPMSPCSPSQLSLVESPSQCSVPEIRKGKNIIPQKFKCRQLSPVLESAFSDNSASDYMPPITHLPSPTLSASSGQGIFPMHMTLQQNQSQLQLLPHYSPPPWDTSVLQQTRFQPFSQPRGMTDPVSWSSRSNSPLFQVETPAGAQALFGHQHLEKNELSNSEGSAAIFFVNQHEETQLTLDFPLNQSQTKNLLEDNVFRGLGDEEYETEGFNFGNPKVKISLRDETAVRSSAPQTVPNVHSGLEISNCTDVNSSHPDQNTELLNDIGSLSSCSFIAGYLSSDASDEESCCEPCLQASAFYMDDLSCEEHLNSDSQMNPKVSKLLRPNMTLRDDQDFVENVVSPNKTSGFQGQQLTLSSSPHTLGRTQNSEFNKCKKTPPENQDAGTQAVPKTCDASTQCSFVTNGESRGSGCSLYDMLEQQPETQRQAASLKTTTQERWASWKEFTANKVFLQRPTNPLQGVFSPRGKENKGDRDEREDDENNRLIKEASDGREEVTFAGRIQRRSEEASTLQEIAKILLLLKQKKKEE